MNDSSETALMRLIRDRFGAYIGAAAKGTQIPESFLAALTANESGGNADVKRYEPYELGKFAELLAGDIDGYQGISADRVMAKLNGTFSVPAAVKTLMNYCTSWGPTQMMGWHALKDGYELGALLALKTHYALAAAELGRFVSQFHIPMDDATKKWENCAMLFHCWNAGAPNRPTSDDGYTERGIARMKIYEGLA